MRWQTGLIYYIILSYDTEYTEKRAEIMKKTGRKIIILITAVAVVYVGVALFFQNRFCFGTSIGGIAVGGRNAAGVERLIREKVENYSLALYGRDNVSNQIEGKDISLEPIFQGEVEQLIQEQKGYRWILILIKGEELHLSQKVAYDEDALSDLINEMPFVTDRRQRAPINATYSSYSEKDGYTLVPADYGNKIDVDALNREVKVAIEQLETEIDLSERGCYVAPEVGDDDAGLLTLLEDLNRYVGTVITYELGDEAEVLDAQTISTWLGDENGVIAVDEEAVLTYVKDLARKYNTAYRPKELETSYGETVTITNGFYGWRIDNALEVEQILVDLQEGKHVTREPVYAQTANSRGEHDYGDSYVEINLTAQHLFLYKDGELIIETDFVSGNVANGNATPTGAFGITYKTRDAVLRGDDYATPVTYWMPYAGDVGMHDATWRRNFGGNIYKTNGSHGCVNLPVSAAKEIYEVVEKGYPVLVYTLPGTESVDAMQQDAAHVVTLIDTIGPVTLESETIIVAARNLYNALPSTAKGFVTNIDTLIAAEATLEQLKAAQPVVQ